MEEKVYKLGLLGYPLGHSLSPVLYDVAFKAAGLKHSYELLPTQSEDLIDRIKRLRVGGYFGFNVTIPHKVPVAMFLTKYDEYVNMVGAVNTVKIEEDLSLSGYNTDVVGFIEPLKEYDLKNKKAAVLGTGGASRAICAGLYKLGIKEIDIYTRNIINSKETVDTLRGGFCEIKFNVIQNSLMKDFSDIDILVNTTPVGMKNFDENNCLVEEKLFETMKEDTIIYDIVYNPIKTQLISNAIKFNKKYICGLDMLVHQAACAFEIWTGQKPDWKLMKIKALEEYIVN
jgi:shikimate dehydrogenase